MIDFLEDVRDFCEDAWDYVTDTLNTTIESEHVGLVCAAIVVAAVTVASMVPQ